MTEGPPFFCLRADCPGHENTRLICIDPDIHGSPYELRRRQLEALHALEANDLRTRQAERLLALARQFSMTGDYKFWMQRLRQLRHRREEIDAL
jgi:hypothetical protein